MDERAFLAGAESADADELARVLAEPTPDEETALRKHLGNERFESMRGLALETNRRDAARSAQAPKGNVVVTHGIMGSTLSVVGRRGGLEPVWLNPLRLVLRGLDLLRLADDGRAPYRPGDDVRATGLMLGFYGNQVLSLRRRWNVSPFWFDWRRDLNESADELRAHADRTFGPDAPFHVVAHSMGGLVARTFMKRHPERWETMWDGSRDGHGGGRLVMLGTPNHGSYAIPLLLTGLGQAIRLLAAASPHHRLEDLLRIVASFVGTYQMLPSPHRAPEAQLLYDSRTYAGLSVPRIVPQSRLDGALRHHELLLDAVDAERMVYVAGYGLRTVSGIGDVARLDSLRRGYTATEMAGDGTVPHDLGLLETPDGQKMRMYFVRAAHGDLPRDERVNAALDELLETGTTGALSEEMPLALPGAPSREDSIDEEAADHPGDLAGPGSGAGDAAPPNTTSAAIAKERRAEELAEELRAKSGRPGAQASLEPEEADLSEMIMSAL